MHLAPDLEPSLRRTFEEKLSTHARTVANAGNLAPLDEFVLFLDICRFRRAVVFTNPLLDFNDIVFLKSRFPKVHHSSYQYYGRVAAPSAMRNWP